MSNSDIKNLNNSLPRTDGRTVPDGYFEDFARRMMAQIPEHVPAKVEVKRNVWQKIRPYVYMAAMFAGVYLMMNIFTLTAGLRNGGSTGDVSNLFAELTMPANSAYVDEYFSMSDAYFYDDLYESGYEIPDNI